MSSRDLRRRPLRESVSRSEIRTFIDRAGIRLVDFITTLEDDIVKGGFESESRCLDSSINDHIEDDAKVEVLLIMRIRMLIETLDADEAEDHYNALIEKNLKAIESRMLSLGNNTFKDESFHRAEVIFHPDSLNVLPGPVAGTRQYLFDDAVFITLY